MICNCHAASDSMERMHKSTCAFPREMRLRNLEREFWERTAIAYGVDPDATADNVAYFADSLTAEWRKRWAK